MTEIQDVGQLYPDQALRANDGKNSEDNEFKVNPTHWEKAPFSLVICGIGNFLVWYDFNLIAFFADDLGDAFFPDESNIAQFTEIFIIYGSYVEFNIYFVKPWYRFFCFCFCFCFDYPCAKRNN